MHELAAAPADALAAGAVAAPDAPLLFFRGPRGHFTWWSWRRCEKACVGGPTGDEGSGAAAALDYLRGVLARAGDAERRSARALLRRIDDSGGRREIWLTRGDLDRLHERALATAALAGGWAIVHEPGPSIHAETFAWARPSVVGGAANELLTLLDGFARLAPRWRRRSWAARRLRRLSAVVIEPGGDGSAIAARLRALGSLARVLPIPPGGW